MIVPRVIASAAAVLLVLGIAATPVRADDATEEALRFARARFDEASFGDAAEGARAVLEDEPRHEEALSILARSLESTGGYGEAEKALREAVAGVASPTAAPAEILLGELLLRRGEAAGALEAFDRARAGGANRFRTAAGRAEALLHADRRAEAEGEIRALFAAYQETDDADLGPPELLALARGARVAERLPGLVKEHNRPFAAEARDFYQRAYKAGASGPDTLVEWGRIYAEKWDIGEARRLAKEALKKSPRHPGAHVLLAETLLQDFFGGTAKYEKANAEVDQALGVNPKLPEAHLLRAELLITDALYGEALASLAEALATRPNDVRALAAEAGIYQILDDKTRAAEIEKAVLARGRIAGSEFCARLSEFLDSKFRYREAHAYARRSVEIDPDHWPAYGRLGFAAMRVGDEKTAREYLEKANEADPFDLFTFNQLKLLDYLEKEFETFHTEHFTLRLHRSEVAALKPYLLELLARCWGELERRYGVEKLDGPILVEVFPNLNDFSVRAVAHRFIPASGVTFARVVAIASPAAFPPGTHGFGRVLWHELAHVATLERSNYRVPRWLTEGIAVFEESKGHKAWVREWDVDLVDALDRGRLLPILELNEGFSKPKFPNQVMLSYYQGGLICQFIEQTAGFDAILKLLDGYREGLSIDKNLERAVGLTPAEFDRRFLAYARKSLGDIPYRAPVFEPAALVRLRKELKAKPKDKELLTRFAFAAADLGRFADAEVAAAQLRALDPRSGDAALVEALIALERGNHDAIPKLAAEARANGTRAPIQAYELEAGYWLGKPKGAKAPRDVRRGMAALEAAHRLWPRHPGYMLQLAELYKEANEGARRREMLVKIAEARPNDVQTRAELVELADGAKDEKVVARWLEELLWLDPRAPGMHERLARARLRLGDLTGARKEAEVFASFEPRDPKADALLAEIKAAEAAAPAPAPEAPPKAPGRVSEPM